MNNKAKRTRKDILSVAIPTILIVVFVYVFFTYCVQRAKILSGSMEPFLMTGEVVYVNKLAYIKNDIQRGDVVWFVSEEPSFEGELFVKRVIGLPGDRITFEDGLVFINGVMLDESAYIASGVETNSIKVFDVPEGCYFMLGDNRENSHDSRMFDNPYIARDKIIGKYLGKEKFWQ